jgi:hydroxymethylglutaryl-CoA reductase (NADPH)
MPSAFDAARRMIAAMLAGRSAEEIAKQSRPDTTTPLKPWIRPAKRLEPTFTAANWKVLLANSGASEADKAELYDAKAQDQLERYEHNVENYIGTLRLPVGVIGPLRVNGIFAKGDFYVPLATSEAALVASYGRGARLISSVGGATTGTLAEGVHRSPGFAFASTTEAGLFVAWVCQNFEMLKAAAETTTRHGKLVELSPHVEGDHVYLVCSYTTGDAAGQNMVTIATEAVCAAILEASPVKPVYWFVEANFSGDKKASAMSFVGVRGRKVTASVELPGAEIEKQLHTTARRMEEYWRMSALGGVMSGSIGAGALRERPRGAVSGDGTGCGVRGGERGRRDAHGAAARRGQRPAVRLGDVAEHHRGDGGRRDGASNAERGAEHSRAEGRGQGAGACGGDGGSLPCGRAVDHRGAVRA